MAEPLRLPADLVVSQVVRRIRPDAGLGRAVHTARPEALREGPVYHLFRRDFVGQVHARHVAALRASFVEIGARRVGDDRLLEANEFTRGVPDQVVVPERVAVEALQCVVGLEIAQTARKRPL